MRLQCERNEDAEHLRIESCRNRQAERNRIPSSTAALPDEARSRKRRARRTALRIRPGLNCIAKDLRQECEHGSREDPVVLQHTRARRRGKPQRSSPEYDCGKADRERRKTESIQDEFLGEEIERSAARARLRPVQHFAEAPVIDAYELMQFIEPKRGERCCQRRAARNR